MYKEFYCGVEKNEVVSKAFTPRFMVLAKCTSRACPSTALV